jgi:hypothetical protein
VEIETNQRTGTKLILLEIDFESIMVSLKEKYS